MSIRAENLKLEEPGEPVEVSFLRLRTDIENLLSPYAEYNGHDWWRIEGSDSTRYVSHDVVMRHLPSQELELRRTDAAALGIIFTSRVHSEADFRQSIHVIDLGPDIGHSSRLSEVQEYECSFGKALEAGPREMFHLPLDAHCLTQVREILGEVSNPPDPKGSFLRRAASWLIHH